VHKECVARVARYATGRLLDVGCGDKPYIDILSPYVDSYVGLEHPATLHQNDMIDLFGDACYLPFKSESFDTVVSFEVMEHVSEPQKMIAEANRVLVKGGNAIFSTPFMWGVHEAPNDYYRFTAYGLRYLFSKCGFTILELFAKKGFWTMAGLRLNYRLDGYAAGTRRLALAPIFFGVQVLARTLDNIARSENDTLGYLIVAKKT
jgi:SAM-dependent methyltransferase